MSLVTYADLTAPAVTQPNETVGQMSVTRISTVKGLCRHWECPP